MNKSLKKKQRLAGYAFLIPNFIIFIVFTLFPVIASLIISFTNWDGFGEFRFIGLNNYIKLIKDETFGISLGNTLYYTCSMVFSVLVISPLIAIGLNKQIKGIGILRTAYFIPNISSIVAIAIVWQLIFNQEMGPINNFLRGLSVDNPPRWLGSPQWAMTAVIIMSIWKNTGYYMIMYLAGLQSIPNHMYEAAKIDGANALQKLICITIPMLSPTTFFVLVITIINSLKVFDQIYVMTQGGPGRATNVLVYNIYVEAFEKFKFGYASAIAYVLFIITLIFTLMQFKGQKKYVNYLT